jgi:4-hydroxy-3-polyprenylbenzoate decarboxylase
VSVSTLNPVIFPGQTDKLGFAGAIQGFPVDVVKARTVDAYAMANAEWSLEGYVLEGERVWETEEAERLGKQGVALLHPEWARSMGHAYRTPRAFELTAVTRRKKNPIVYTPHFGAFWYEAPFMCASVYELCDRMAPGFVKDVASWLGLTLWGGLIIQVNKRRRSDEGMQRNLLTAIMGLYRGMRLVVMVDEDIDPWQPEDVMWAIQSRASASKDYVVYNEYGRGQAFQPSELKIGNISVSDGGMGIDATAPLGAQVYERAKYPVDEMDFSKWFTQEEVDGLKDMQDPYFRWLGETGHG